MIFIRFESSDNLSSPPPPANVNAFDKYSFDIIDSYIKRIGAAIEVQSDGSNVY